MRRIGWVVAVLGVVGVAGCYGGGKAPAATEQDGQQGSTGQFYFVTLLTPPLGGVVTSDDGQIACGARSQSVASGNYVYEYFGPAGAPTNRCGPAQVEWSKKVVLSAAPEGGNAFIGWASDCAGTGPCTLEAGADRTVVAVFGPPGSGHANFMNPAVHAPAYFAFLSGTGPLQCNVCHGPSLAGLGIAPSCTDCHEQAGWTGWQSNCSFCHGASTPGAKAGYAFASHPEWSAPPAAISERLTGAPAPDRSGAHQAHLTGATPAGFSVAAPFRCETCHPVPSDLSHVSGAASRARVVLSGAGQASLPDSLGTYDQAAGTCTTWCHRSAPSPRWSSTGMECGDCHGVPPGGTHPYQGSDMSRCAPCHPDTMRTDGTLNVAGGKHVDGIVQAIGHPDWTPASTHGPRFFAYLAGTEIDCKSCHGATFDGGFGPSCNACHQSAGWTASWQRNCSFCHGTRNDYTKANLYDVNAEPTLSAPPDAISQRLGGPPAPDRTGAHRTHLTGKGSSSGTTYSAAFPCATCHVVPSDYAHAAGPERAPVTLVGSGGLPASLGAYDPVMGTCTTYCHGSTLADRNGVKAPPPSWAGAELGCTGCHGNPPASGQHEVHVTTLLYRCYVCHSGTASTTGAILGDHLNGATNVQFYVPGTTWNGTDCSSRCHEGPAYVTW